MCSVFTVSDWCMLKMQPVEQPKIKPNIRQIRHAVAILDIPQYRPLSMIEGFNPCKTCCEYVEQDCAEALPKFRQHSRALVHSARQVSWLCQSSVFYRGHYLLLPAVGDFQINNMMELFVMRHELHSCVACLQMTACILDEGKSCGLDHQQVLALVRFRP
jgi:hypothetical protein